MALGDVGLVLQDRGDRQGEVVGRDDEFGNADFTDELVPIVAPNEERVAGGVEADGVAAVGVDVVLVAG